MKFLQKYWLPLLIIALVILSLILNHRNKQKQDSFLPDHVAQEINTTDAQCFIYEEPVVLDPNQPELQGFNREIVMMTITEAGLATGQHMILPFETDSNRAEFIGIAEGGFVNVVATAHAEGETWQEQRVYQIQPDRLLVGYQEIYVPQYQDENGIYLYEDINKLKFETEEFYLSRVNCEDIHQEHL